jgi:transglutaminase-like putative cysteine protease
MKGRGADATLAALATLTAAWPIATLLAEPTWVSGTLLLLAVIVLSGVSARSLDLRSWQVLVVQVVCTVLSASALFGRGHLWHGLPTGETLDLAARLIREAFATAHAYAAPAPTTPGLTFVVGCALAVTALTVDYLAVTRRSPSLAGLPLLTAFLAAAANSDSSLPVIFFVTAAAIWLILVARAETAILRRWRTTAAVARTPVRESPESQVVYSYASTARTLGMVALIAAVALPGVLPHFPPKYLVSGLGRNPSAGGNGSGTVGFSLSLDLAADLTSGSRVPVLEYRTADSSPPPLRVAASSRYDPELGHWVPQRPRPLFLSRNPDIPQPAGLGPAVPKKSFTMVFSRNRLDEPNLATPYPLIAAHLENIAWGLDSRSQDVRVAQRPDSYALSYWRLQPTLAMLRKASSKPAYEGPFDSNLIMDDRSAPAVFALTKQLTKGKTSAYDQAMAIQQYLRSTGGFRYSLTLAPPARDLSGNGARLDPLTNFLVTKKGYCVQFATAMVMMSRAVGIPARMAIGFLPGTLTKGVWTVTASDAHSWPELYLEGIGWTRFEPTPSRATPPVWAIPATTLGPDAGAGSPARPRTSVPRNTPKDLGDRGTENGKSPQVSPNLTSALGWLTHGWGLVLLAGLVGLLGSLVVPTAARWRRHRDLTAARTSAERVEVQWELLTSSLGDLGIEPAPSRTPRQLRVYYDREAFLDGEASDALGRVVQTLERARYGTTAPVSECLAADARQVLRAAATTRSHSVRLRAAVWPSGGVAQLRSAGTNLVWRIRAPLSDLGKIVHQRFSPPRR